MEKDKVTEIVEKINSLQEEEAEVKKNPAKKLVTDPILAERLLVNHKDRKKFSIKDLLR